MTCTGVADSDIWELGMLTNGIVKGLPLYRVRREEWNGLV